MANPLLNEVRPSMSKQESWVEPNASKKEISALEDVEMEDESVGRTNEATPKQIAEMAGGASNTFE